MDLCSTSKELGLQPPLDNPLRQAARKLQLDVYKDVLEMLQEAFESSADSTSSVLVHASSLLLVDSPEGVCYPML